MSRVVPYLSVIVFPNSRESQMIIQQNKREKRSLLLFSATALLLLVLATALEQQSGRIPPMNAKSRGTGETEFLLRYAKRLGLPEESLLDSQPSKKLLFNLQERHLYHIPFENLGQHGAYGGPVSLDMEKIMDKILIRNRGGFCLELNSLFAQLLRQCGFSVSIIEAVVFQRGTFDGIPPSHVLLVVEMMGEDRTESPRSLYYVDVGFGEPPLHPLEHVWGKEQVTPEGMKSRLVQDDDGEHVILQWQRSGPWEPRLRWRLADALSKESISLKDMKQHLEIVSQEGSPFSKKLVVCRLTREHKYTIAGSSYKITGSPRFPSKDGRGDVPINKQENLSLETVQDILNEQFSIPREETYHLEMERSNHNDAREIWAQW